MKYRQITDAIFVERPNRFIANVEIKGKRETVHVKNTGRCKELLTKGTHVYLAVADNPERKTKYDLIAVEKKRENKAELLINMDSQVVNDVAAEWLAKGELFSKTAIIRREVKYGNSRFDFYIEDGVRKVFLEVKGVTLEHDGVVSFPDAPTERGIKHIRELMQCIEDGYEAYILFVIQMKEVSFFHPNDATHKAFGDTLREARQKGVNILAYDCKVSPDSIELDRPVVVQYE